MSDVLPGLSQAITSSPILSHLLTVGGQSLFLLAAFLGADVLSRKYWPHVHKATSHTLWQFAFLMLALMPVLPFLSAGLHRALPESRLVSPVFEVLVRSTEAAARSNGPGLAEVVVTLYVMVALALLLRLGLACIRLRRMRRTATPVEKVELHRELATVKARLGMDRDVVLATSADIDSPVSFGCRPAHVLLPPRSDEWSPDVLTDVLLHELCHIRRHDWLMLMASHVLCALYWFNPLVWLARRHLLARTENRCDRDVLFSGRDHVTYAESLLSVARSCHARQRVAAPDIPAQPMFERKTLKTRLSHVLEETTMKNRNIAGQMRKGMAGMAAFTLLVMAALVFNPILLAQDSQNQPDPDDRQVDQELMPLHTEEPVYPEEASANDVGGWVQVRFTISDEGTVVADSVSVVDAEPAGVFEESAMAATKQFRFRPRIVDGVAQTIPGVQYVFRFDPDE
ncbi:MAG: TonB family protein [Pseudomonadota bacterium]